jgi:hypothetical protein
VVVVEPCVERSAVIDIQSDRNTQYGGPDRATTGQTYADPRIARAGGKQPDDNEYGNAVGGNAALRENRP